MNLVLRPEAAAIADGASGAAGWVRARFRAALAGFGRGPILILAHHDADGLAAGVLLARALQAGGRPSEVRIVGRGENPWAPEMRRRLQAGPAPAGLIVADLGVRPGEILPGVPTLLIDHHRPQGEAAAAVITGHALSPIPTSSLLAYWCAGALTDPEPWLWLAALGLIGDLAENAGFAEMAQARSRYRVSALREAVSLINAPRRSASGDASPALALLLSAQGPQDIVSGADPRTAVLAAAREEVRTALAAARRIAPRLVGGVGLIRFASPCQIHPLIAQQWRGRLKNQIVMAANTGFRPGWVHFAVRAARDVDLIEFLAEHAPPGADENFGSGHRGATGGALRPRDWNAFISSLGFGPEEHVA